MEKRNDSTRTSSEPVPIQEVLAEVLAEIMGVRDTTPKYVASTPQEPTQ